MATIYREFIVSASATDVWAAIRDFGAVHTRLAVGFVTGVRLEGDIREVTFANGFVVKEQLVGSDDEHMRMAYSAVGGRASHHNASFQVFPDGDRHCRIVWITDLLPDEAAAPVGAMVDMGVAAMQRTLEGRA